MQGIGVICATVQSVEALDRKLLCGILALLYPGSSHLRTLCHMLLVLHDCFCSQV